MWVQLHGLSFGMMNRAYGNRIENQIGEVIDIDVDKNGLGWGPFFRVRVQINITKPLHYDTLLNQEGTPIWIPFKYERLPNFCFNCGVILHTSIGCNNDRVGNEFHDIEPNQYKTWLRASTAKISRKTESPSFGQ